MITLNSIQLHSETIWSDEWDWAPVRQRVETTLTGKLGIEEAVRPKGRPITLTGGWASRSQVEQLKSLEAQPGIQMTLLIHGSTKQVVWRHRDKGVDAQPVRPVTDPDPTDHYEITLRLMEV